MIQDTLKPSCEIKPEWFLSADEERLALARALFDKIKRLQWQSKNSEWITNESDEVVLTEDEKDKALAKANSLKGTRLYFQNLVNEKRQREQELRDKEFGEWNALRFGEEMQRRSRDAGTKLVVSGTEYDKGGAVKYYGSEINWFKTFIEEYYAKYPNAFHRLMFSTNDNFDTLEAKYGFRVRDRLAEKFDVLDVSGKSFRRNG